MERSDRMYEADKEKGKALAHMPPPERNKLVARLMFGQSAAQATMAMFMLMGAWGIAPPGPPPGAHGPPGGPPGGSPGGPPHP